MPTYRSNSTDTTTWALIAIVAVLLAGGIGWAIARSQHGSWADVQRTQAIARQNGAVQGYQKGRAAGARTGSKEARLLGRIDRLRAARSSYSSGYRQGVQQGRNEARTRAGGGTGLDLSTLGTGLSSTDGGFGESTDELLATSALDTLPADDTSDYAGYGSDAAAAYDSSLLGLGPDAASSYDSWYRGGTRPAYDG